MGRTCFRCNQKSAPGHRSSAHLDFAFVLLRLAAIGRQVVQSTAAAVALFVLLPRTAWARLVRARFAAGLANRFHRLELFAAVFALRLHLRRAATGWRRVGNS